MSWPFETSEPHVTPEIFLEHFCAREGLTREQVALPRVAVATFQGGSFARLVERTGAEPPRQLSASAAAGSALGSSFRVGWTPGSRAPVAVARLPVGAPATALTLEIAIARGVRDVLVCGSAGSLQPDLPLGSIVVVEAAEREDGTSHHYLRAGEPTAADPDLTSALASALAQLRASPTRGRAWTIDAPFRETVGAIRRHRDAGVAVVEMEAAAIFAVAQVRAARAALVIAVSDELFHPWNPGFHLPVYHDALLLAADAVLRVADLLGS
jgi:nucleoside phosphorylase